MVKIIIGYINIVMIACFCSNAMAQSNEGKAGDTLPVVVVHAFNLDRKLKDVPAAINYVDNRMLTGFNNSTIVQAINVTPGVRMEERSPGSYRFNIRGSSLRSPFGVRNIKVYYNDIPVTDPGGQTYLNQLGFYNYQSIEIIKGPGSSLYGAGTGGALLIQAMPGNEKSQLVAEYTKGSFGLNNIVAVAPVSTGKSINRILFQHIASDGYRNHSALKRNVFSWDGRHTVGERNVLQTTFLYGDLFYETPGALTKAEFDKDSRASRPAAGAFPSAEQAKASISQKTFIAGLSYDQHISARLSNKTTAYGMFTQLTNPTIQNYSRSNEPHVGGRTSFNYKFDLKQGKMLINAGAELQKGFTTVNIYKNLNGTADSLRSNDAIQIRQAILFVQCALDYKTWTLTAGGSVNFLKTQVERFSPASLGVQSRVFNNQFAPRVAVMKKFGFINLYTGLARGFSPPTTAELYPTGGAINLDLNAESGFNYDVGVKGNIYKSLYIDINAFWFGLRNAIVQRRNAGGGDFYINAGKTRQNGLETYLNYPIIKPQHFINNTILWLSHTWHNFHYKDFRPLNNDYSGNQMPSVPRHTISTGIDLKAKGGWTGTVSYYFAGKIPLNDANTDYADAYHLVAGKLAYTMSLSSRLLVKLSGGVDNLLNQKYSLGNDSNGFGGRYYNAAARRNYFITIGIEGVRKERE